MFMLVGDQTIPNLMPFLQLCMERPDRANTNHVVLVTTRHEPLKYAVDNLRHFLLDRYAGQLEEEDLSQCEGGKMDLPLTLSVCRDEIIRLRHKAAQRNEDLELYFNMTSGTKIMALATYQLALETGGHLVYLDSDRNQILHLLPEAREEPLLLSLTVPDYLKAHGYRVNRVELYSGQVETEQIHRYSVAAKILGQMSSEVVRNLAIRVRAKGILEFDPVVESEEFRLIHRLNHLLWEVQETCEPPKVKVVLKWLVNPQFFPGGKWLEQYAFDCALSLVGNSPICEVMAGLTIQREIENELDLAFSWGQHLALCSCKVGQKLESQWIYDLNDRARSLGTFCKKILIISPKTAQAVSFRERARRDKILVLDGLDLPVLKERFATLVATSQNFPT
jgi:hypothetical protein